MAQNPQMAQEIESSIREQLMPEFHVRDEAPAVAEGEPAVGA